MRHHACARRRWQRCCSLITWPRRVAVSSLAREMSSRLGASSGTACPSNRSASPANYTTNMHAQVCSPSRCQEARPAMLSSSWARGAVCVCALLQTCICTARCRIPRGLKSLLLPSSRSPALIHATGSGMLQARPERGTSAKP